MSAIVWEDPETHAPLKARAPAGSWMPVLTGLQEKPREWGMIREYDNLDQARSAASNLRRGIIKKPAGLFEFKANRGRLYGRYLGPEGE